MTTGRTSVADRIEGGVQLVILLAVGAMSAAASFTHVHDWTMANAPGGTGDWFGWANAMVSDLVPLGVGLEVRRRRRLRLPIGRYPIVVILAAAALSLAGQFAQARPSVSGWLLAAVPALGFLALTKLVLSRPTTPVPVTTVVDEDHDQDHSPEPTPSTPVNDAAPVSTVDTTWPEPVRANGYAIGSGVVR